MTHDLRTLGSISSLRGRLLVGGLLGLGLGSGCYIETHETYGHEACLDDYYGCIADAEGSEEIEACKAAKSACLESCGDDGWRGDDHDHHGDDDGVEPPGSDDGGPPPSDGADAGDDGDAGDLPNPACFEIHVTCVGQATTIAEVDACEALFEHCLEAEPCDHTCEPVCPDPGVSACLDVYAACAAVAGDAGAVAGCAAGFDVCVSGLDDSACVPQDPTVVDACLEQHALCTACLDDPEEAWLCKDVFDTCVAG